MKYEKPEIHKLAVEIISACKGKCNGKNNIVVSVDDDATAKAA